MIYDATAVTRSRNHIVPCSGGEEALRATTFLLSIPPRIWRSAGKNPTSVRLTLPLELLASGRSSLPFWRRQV